MKKEVARSGAAILLHHSSKNRQVKNHKSRNACSTYSSSMRGDWVGHEKLRDGKREKGGKKNKMHGRKTRQRNHAEKRRMSRAINQRTGHRVHKITTGHRESRMERINDRKTRQLIRGATRLAGDKKKARPSRHRRKGGKRMAQT